MELSSEQIAARLVGAAFALSIGCTIFLLLAEAWRPLTGLRHTLRRRWLANLWVFAIASVIQRGLGALSLFSLALLAADRGWGLFHRWELPIPLVFAASILAVDLAGYTVHRLSHRVPLLWRMHRLHHSDPDVDVTTSFRFHPFEVVLRLLVLGAAVLAVGALPLAVAAYIAFAAVDSVLSHANLRLPRALDRALGLVALTPEMHRTHHSIDFADSHSNFGVCLTVWDRIFRTFRVRPTLGHEMILFGVDGRTARDATSILGMLADPFLPEGPAAVRERSDSNTANPVTVPRGS